MPAGVPKQMTMDTTITAAYSATKGGVGLDATLVSLFDTQNLYALARDKTPESRADLSEKIATVFDLDLKTQEAELAADIMLSLLQQAELDLRQALSQRLAASNRIPLRVALSLANDDISVAKSILSHSPVLDEYDLLYIVQSKTPEYWQAIAQRRDLTHGLIGTLAEKRDLSTAKTLLDNDAIDIPDTSLRIFTEMAKTAEILCVPLMHRPELPESFAQELYWAVSAELRKRIVERLPDRKFAFIVDQALESVQQDIVNTAAGKIQTSTDKVKIHNARVVVSPSRMIEALRLGQLSYFTALLAEYTELKGCMIETLLRQKGGRGLAIACKARKMERNDFMTLFMLKSALATANKVVDHGELAQALNHFDRVDTDFAQGMLVKARKGQEIFA